MTYHLSLANDLAKEENSIKGYKRPQESTYLIFPEWYIVYSSKEYAQLLKNKLPSQFPYFSAIEQYWCSYHTVLKLTDVYPFNWGDNLMLMVIGVSLSVEYTIKGLYENSIGRLTEWLSGNQPVEEDKYAQKVAQAYADFIPLYPWFDFSFSQSLSGLWHGTSWYGPHMIRKSERKLYLSMEYGLKTVYAKIIGAGSHSTYGTASDSIYGALGVSPLEVFNAPKVTKIAKVNQDTYIVTLPHEQPFTDAALSLVGTNSHFIDIAGNDSILVTIIAPKDWEYHLLRGNVVFSMNILTQPSLKRIGIQMPVDSLLDLIAQLKKENIYIEHLYDF